MNKDLFNKILSSFRDEYILYSRNSYSKFQSIKLSEKNKLSNYEINSAASIIANNYGSYIQEKGEKAIELFLNYLKLYNAPKVNNDELKLISEEIRNSLKSTADFARISMKQYAASKGMERQLRLDTYEIGKELNDRIEPILNTLKIEINKYNIQQEVNLNNKINSNNKMDIGNKIEEFINRYKILLENATYDNRYQGDYQTLKIETENYIRKKFGDTELNNFRGLPKIRAVIIGENIDIDKEMKLYKKQIHDIISRLEGFNNICEDKLSDYSDIKACDKKTNIFIGHGHSNIWLVLKNFLEDKLNLDCEEYNSSSTAGKARKERLEELLNISCFAFLIMTGEDELKDNSLRARENVVHEIGLFQGRLGFEKAIVLLENGCQEFSNIHGIGQIRFNKDNLKESFEEIRDVLKRENIIN